MKKNVLALSITAALIGLTGSAHAVTELAGAANGGLGGANATGFAINAGGVGQVLLVPYFTTQGSNVTAINLTNTDTVYGKAVKIRFRGAANSDDLFDFQVYLSPGDVWAAGIKKGADGKSILFTEDVSCTKPAKSVIVATSFGTSRLDSTMTADQQANGTREGYVEIFNMADIPAGKAHNVVADGVIDLIGATTAGIDAAVGSLANPLFTAIKHVNKVAPCAGAAWTAIDTNNMDWDDATARTTTPRAFGFLPPTTGLSANWFIINMEKGATWSGEATAIQTTGGTTGNVVYWPQIANNLADQIPAQDPDLYTADPILRSTYVYKWDGSAYVAVTTPAVKAQWVDLPDLSTPYTMAPVTTAVGAANAAGSTSGPRVQAFNLTNSLAVAAVGNEVFTLAGVNASTDWVFSTPTRRYSTAFHYGATIAATDDGRRFTSIIPSPAAATTVVGLDAGNSPADIAQIAVNAYFNRSNTVVGSAVAGSANDTNGNGRQICVTKTTMTTVSRDREETSITGTAIVVSPAPANPQLVFCGETAVLSMNSAAALVGGTKSLSASVATKNLDVTYPEGWLRIATPGATTLGLPVLGSAFLRAGVASAPQNYGITWKHRTVQ